MPELVRTSIEDSVLSITLNRPEKRNALSPAVIESLRDAVEAAHDDGSIHAVILAGEGKCFCAGMDLRGVISDVPAMSDMLHTLGRTMLRIRRLPVPTIAKVQGAAIGGGCGLAVVCDIAITHAEAKLGYPEVDLGLCPAVVAPWVIRKIGAGPARAMLLTGGTMSGAEAFERGLVDRLCEHGALAENVENLARQFASGGRRALATTKRWLNELDGSLDERMVERAAALSAEVIAGEEAQERLRMKFGD